MELATQIFQFILSISILITLHELGHFIPAKWFKTKVEKFYLFFDPWFSLMKKKIGETVYGIGWLPLGGYVKIAGMVDESMDTEQLKKPAQPWEFRSKPAWQRLIIMLGGVTVNFFLAWFIYSCLSFFNGENYHSNSLLKHGISISPGAKKMGFQTGDIILEIDGKPAERLENSIINLLFSNEATVLRNGKKVTFSINQDGIAEIFRNEENQKYIQPRFPLKIGQILQNETTEKISLKSGDIITNINNREIRFLDELQKELDRHKGQTVQLSYIRNGQPHTTEVKVNKNGKIGFFIDPEVVQKSFEDIQITQKYSFTEALPRGFTRTIDALVMQVKQFKIIFNSKTQGYKKVSGPIGIVKMMPTKFDWVTFWSFTAMFSIWLAFLNLLPIPGLDGGHVMFTLWEIITGKPIPQKVLENAQIIGIILLMGLMFLIFGNDIYKTITGKM